MNCLYDRGIEVFKFQLGLTKQYQPYNFPAIYYLGAKIDGLKKLKQFYNQCQDRIDEYWESRQSG